MDLHDTMDEELQRIRLEKLRRMVENANATVLPGEGVPLHVSSLEHFTGLVNQHRHVPVLVDFWADWCGPCRALAPVFEAAAARFAGKALFLKVNTDQLPALARQFNVSNIPDVILLVGNVVKGRWIGTRPLSVYIDAIDAVMPASPA